MKAPRILSVLLPILYLFSAAPAQVQGAAAISSPPVIRATNGRHPAAVRYTLPLGGAQAWLTRDAVWLSYVNADGQGGRHLRLDFGGPLDWTVVGPAGIEVCVTNPDGAAAQPAAWRQARAPLPGGAELIVSANGLVVMGAGQPALSTGFEPALPDRRDPVNPNIVNLNISGSEPALISEGSGDWITAAGRPVPLSWSVPIMINGQPAGTSGSAAPHAPAGGSASELLFSTYIGGTNWDEGEAVIRDPLGRTYVAGQTLSIFFPTSPGPFTGEALHNVEAFIARLSWDGAGIDFICTIRGDVEEWAPAMAVDNFGNAYMVGRTDSTESIPFTPGAYDTTFNGNFDLFVMKFSPSGALLVSTLLGGGEDEFAGAIAAGPSGEIYVTGSTGSDGATSVPFPTTVDAYKSTHAGARDIFLAVLSADGSELLYSSLAGGAGNDHVEALRLHGETAVMAGWTTSPDFDTPAGGYDTTLAGGFDALVLALAPGDPALEFWTYLGGTADGFTGDRALGLDVDAAGRVYIVGSTYADDFPVTPGAFDESFDDSCLCADGFAAAFSADGTDLLWASYLGGDGEDSVDAVKLDSAGDLVLAGTTASADFPVSPDALDGSLGGDSDAFVARLSASGAALPYATYLGGSIDEAGNGVWVIGAGWIAVTGWSNSPDFPTTPGSYDPAHNFDKDVFVTVLIPPGAAALEKIFLPLVFR